MRAQNGVGTAGHLARVVNEPSGCFRLFCRRGFVKLASRGNWNKHRNASDRVRAVTRKRGNSASQTTAMCAKSAGNNDKHWKSRHAAHTRAAYVHCSRVHAKNLPSISHTRKIKARKQRAHGVRQRRSEAGNNGRPRSDLKTQQTTCVNRETRREDVTHSW